jgi:hypothetical protein
VHAGRLGSGVSIFGCGGGRANFFLSIAAGNFSTEIAKNYFGIG